MIKIYDIFLNINYGANYPLINFEIKKQLKYDEKKRQILLRDKLNELK